MGLFSTLLHYLPLYVAKAVEVNAAVVKKRDFSVSYTGARGHRRRSKRTRKSVKKQFFKGYYKVLNEALLLIYINIVFLKP